MPLLRFRILISTDAGGEGLNLQFLPCGGQLWTFHGILCVSNKGSVGWIVFGQKHKVFAINFVLEDTVEYRVREVLEEKLSGHP